MVCIGKCRNTSENKQSQKNITGNSHKTLRTSPSIFDFASKNKQINTNREIWSCYIQNEHFASTQLIFVIWIFREYLLSIICKQPQRHINIVFSCCVLFDIGVLSVRPCYSNDSNKRQKRKTTTMPNWRFTISSYLSFQILFHFNAICVTCEIRSNTK